MKSSPIQPQINSFEDLKQLELTFINENSLLLLQQITLVSTMKQNYLVIQRLKAQKQKSTNLNQQLQHQSTKYLYNTNLGVKNQLQAIFSQSNSYRNIRQKAILNEIMLSFKPQLIHQQLPNHHPQYQKKEQNLKEEILSIKNQLIDAHDKNKQLQIEFKQLQYQKLTSHSHSTKINEFTQDIQRLELLYERANLSLQKTLTNLTPLIQKLLKITKNHSSEI